MPSWKSQRSASIRGPKDVFISSGIGLLLSGQMKVLASLFIFISTAKGGACCRIRNGTVLMRPPAHESEPETPEDYERRPGLFRYPEWSGPVRLTPNNSFLILF